MDSIAPKKRGVITGIALWSATNPWKAIGAWLLLILITFGLNFVLSPRQATQAELMVGDVRAAYELADEAGYEVRASESVVIRAADGGELDVAQAAEAAADLVRKMEALLEVEQAAGPVPAENGEAALVMVQLSGDPGTATERVEPLLEVTDQVQAAYAELALEQVGDATITLEINEWLNKDVEKATLLSVPVTLVILLLAFGAIVMAGIPMVLGLASVASAVGLWALASQLVPDQGMVMHLIVLVGMAVGVDYSLFYLRRFREERRAGKADGDAIRIAAETAGHSVIVSGAAVVLSMAGLFVTQDTFFGGMATGAILVVLVAMVSSLTVLPALLATCGRWADKPRLPFVWRLTAGRNPRVMPALLRPVVRRPKLALVGSVAVLLLLAAPALGMSLKNAQIEDLPRSLETIQALDRLQTDFPNSSNVNTVTVHVPAGAEAALAGEAADFNALVGARAGLFGAVAEPWIADDERTMLLQVETPHAVGSEAGQESVTELREALLPETFGSIDGAEAYVGGAIAYDMDYVANVMEKLPVVIGIVVALTFVYMFAVYRSVAVALGTVLLNLLSTAAAFGILVLVFQNSWAEPLLGFASSGYIAPWVPTLLFVVLSGLSLDYHVFVVSRVRENALAGMPAQQAVFDGVVRTAGVVTSAAVVMVAVFSIFGSLSFLELKQIGVGLAAAILLDATIIRVMTLPAFMLACRRFLWWPGGKVDRRAAEKGITELEPAVGAADDDGAAAAKEPAGAVV
ncbi:MMPL family transporter [Arthrobacter sp. NPDC055138]